MLKTFKKEDVFSKKVFLRADLDVSVEDGKVIDDTRLEAWFPTLEFLLSQNSKVVLAGHLGRPKEANEAFSLKPIASYLKEKLSMGEIKEGKIDDFKCFFLSENLILLENLRFFKEEEENNEEFSKKLSNLSEVYINDAFASSHRKHASIVGITKYLPSFAGLRLLKEVEELSKVILNPKRPLTVIIGGAKIETKLPLVEKMHHFANYVLVGGEVAEHDKELARVAHEKLSPKEGIKSILLVADLTSDKEDISEHSIQNFIQVINQSSTIVWNGPMGEFEKCFDLGTREIAKAIASTNAHTIIGGGDTTVFLNKEGIIGKFSFVSTGGGAMLEFLAGQELPGLNVLSLS